MKEKEELGMRGERVMGGSMPCAVWSDSRDSMSPGASGRISILRPVSNPAESKHPTCTIRSNLITLLAWLLVWPL